MRELLKNETVFVLGGITTITGVCYKDSSKFGPVVFSYFTPTVLFYQDFVIAGNAHVYNKFVSTHKNWCCKEPEAVAYSYTSFGGSMSFLGPEAFENIRYCIY